MAYPDPHWLPASPRLKGGQKKGEHAIRSFRRVPAVVRSDQEGLRISQVGKNLAVLSVEAQELLVEERGKRSLRNGNRMPSLARHFVLNSRPGGMPLLGNPVTPRWRRDDADKSNSFSRAGALARLQHLPSDIVEEVPGDVDAAVRAARLALGRRGGGRITLRRSAERLPGRGG